MPGSRAPGSDPAAWRSERMRPWRCHLRSLKRSHRCERRCRMQEKGRPTSEELLKCREPLEYPANPRNNVPPRELGRRSRATSATGFFSRKFLEYFFERFPPGLNLAPAFESKNIKRRMSVQLL